MPVTLLVVVLTVGGYLFYKAQNAYGKIFVDSPERPIIVPNAAGTPEIVTDPTQAAGLPTPTPIPDWNGKNRVNILLLGADTNADRKAEGEPALSDTMIIVSIDPTTKQVGMMSIPRDTLVSIPGVGDDKINAAYSAGSLSDITGPGLARATVEYNFHITINYFAVVDFEGFQKIVDTLGGVTLDVPAPIKDDQYPGEQFNYTRVYFHTGLQHMDGLTALRYVRTRHDDNDFARGNRQQQLLEALRQQMTAMNLITKASSLIDDLGDTIRTDIPPGDALRLAKLGTEIQSGNIHSYSLLPALTEQWNAGQPYYLIPDWAKVQQIVNQMIPPAPPAEQSPTAPSVEKPNLEGQVLVENATHINKLAARSAAKLKDEGFLNVVTAQAPDAGRRPTSQVISYSDNLATARLVAQALGLPDSAVIKGDPAQANGNEVVAILGDDAPIPGN